jgi:hypothetical protein
MYLHERLGDFFSKQVSQLVTFRVVLSVQLNFTHLYCCHAYTIEEDLLGESTPLEGVNIAD